MFSASYQQLVEEKNNERGHLKNTVKIHLAYIAVTNGPKTDDFAARFVGTYNEYPPGIEHETTVICKGGPLPNQTALIFASMNPQFYPHPNTDGGRDISGYIDLARRIDCDMMCCMGESVYFQREGWLKRMAEAWEKYGPGMYGFFSSHCVRAHLNTTAFCIAPRLLIGYPSRITTREERYEFEHGKDAFWRRINRMGRPVMFVTWDGCWNPGEWRRAKNIFTRGDQSNLLAFCNHTDRYETSTPEIRLQMARASDSPFR